MIFPHWLIKKDSWNDLEKEFGSYYSDFLELLGNFRELALKEISDSSKRELFFSELVYSDLLDRFKNGEKIQVEQEFQRIFEEYKHNRR